MYESIGELRFGTEEETQEVASLPADVGREFASDKYASPQFMMWREDQRGISELRRSGPALASMGSWDPRGSWPFMTSGWLLGPPS